MLLAAEKSMTIMLPFHQTTSSGAMTLLQMNSVWRASNISWRVQTRLNQTFPAKKRIIATSFLSVNLQRPKSSRMRSIFGRASAAGTQRFYRRTNAFLRNGKLRNAVNRHLCARNLLSKPDEDVGRCLPSVQLGCFVPRHQFG